MDENRKIEELRSRLNVLRGLDTLRSVFGASSHNYEIRRVAEAEVATLENRIGEPLPAQYRRWLLDVGCGAGPHYGLFSPEQVAGEMRYEERGTGGDVASPADITTSDTDRYFETVREAGSRVGVRITANSFNGAIPVSHQGCDGYTQLLIVGEHRGAIFGECGDIIGEPWTAVAAFWPEGDQQRGLPFSFFDWMQDWLERSIASLEQRSA